MAEKKVVYSGDKDAPNDYRDPDEVTLRPTQAELDPRDTEHHYKGPEHELDPEYEETGVPPEVLAGGTSAPFREEDHTSVTDEPPKPVSTAKPYKPATTKEK